MATHEVAAGQIGTPTAFTLTASTVDTVTFGFDVSVVEVISDGAAEVWYTLDGSTPAVGSADAYYLPAQACVDTRQDLRSTTTDVVKLISSGTPKLRVQVGG